MTRIVVMAGGRGARLHPLTEKTPKPLLEVGGRPILEQIIEMYAEQGLKDFTFCLGYRADQIEAYFRTGKRFGVNIDYVRENEPMGTAGALSLIGQQTEPFIVTNADVLTKLNAKDLIKAHKESLGLITVCTALYQHQIPFGVIDSDGHKFIQMREKPIENFPVNAGIYVLSPKVSKLISGARQDMPDLIDAAKARGWGVTTYPLRNFWVDIGRFDDLARAQAMAS